MGHLTSKDAWDNTEPLSTKALLVAKTSRRRKWFRLGVGEILTRTPLSFTGMKKQTLVHRCSILKDWSLVVWNLEPAELQRRI